MRIFTDQSRRMGSSGVEVSERDCAPSWVGIANILDDHLREDLGSTVDGFGYERAGLRNWDGFRSSIDGGAGRVDKTEAVVLAHDLRASMH